MYTFTTEIEAELAKSAVRFVELFRLDLGEYGGTPYVYHLSDRTIPASVSFDGEAYEARLTRNSADKLPRGRDDKTTIEIYNGDGFVTDLMNAGIFLEHGRLSVVRQFILSGTAANVLNVGDWTAPYWHGRITALESLTKERAVCEVQFGYLDFSKRFGRTLAPYCEALFADGFYCPNDPANGYGRVNATLTGTATGADSTHLYDTGVDFSVIDVGDIVVAGNDTDGTSGVVTATATGELTVGGWSHGTPAADWHYEVGPKYTSCGFTIPDCEARGMYGPSKNVNDWELNWSRRRYFVGYSPSSEEKVKAGRRKLFGLKRMEYTSVPQQAGGIYEQPIPIPVGATKLTLSPVAWLQAQQYTHFFVYFGEGRMGAIVPGSVSVNGLPADDIGGTTQGATDDSLILGGFDDELVQISAGDESAVTSGELNEAQRQSGVGILESYAYQQKIAISTYKSNPNDFNSSDGSGLSPAGCAWGRIRVQGQIADPANAVIEALVYEGTMMLKTDLETWTGTPDVAELAMNACINGMWGGGLSIEQINQTALQAFSDHCRTEVDYSQTDVENKHWDGTVLFGPEDIDAYDSDTNWFAAVFAGLAPSIFTGWFATVTTGGTPQTRHVVNVLTFNGTQQYITLPSGYTIELPEAYRGYNGAIVFCAQPFLSAYGVPKHGDSVSLTAEATPADPSAPVVYRYMANGTLNLEERNFGDALDEILRCANASWFQNLGQIYFAPRAQVDTSSLTTPTITDKGSSRNVISGSVEFLQDPPAKAYNAVRVRYLDRADGYASTTVLIKDQDSQIERKTRFGEDIRDEVKGTLYLPVVNNLDQASRVGTMIARQLGIRSDGKRNARVRVEMPAHLAMKLQPVVDVCPLDLDGLPDWVQYGRVESIDEGRLGLVSTVEFSVYNHADHADDPYDFHRDRYPGEITDDQGNTVRFQIESLTEALITDKQGGTQSAVDIEYTTPISELAIKAVLGWKYESEPLRSVREVSSHRCDYLNDSNGAIDGNQNQVRLVGIPYDVDSENVDVVLVPEYADGSRESVVWLPTTTTAELDTGSGIDDSTQTVDVLEPVSGTFAVGDVAKIQNEYVRITSITPNTPDASHDRWTVVRGIHGSSAVAHADGVNAQKVAPSVALGTITLAGVTTGLSAPSSLVASGIHEAIVLTWTSNLTAEQFKQLDAFVLFWKEGSSMGSWNPNTDALPDGVTEEPLTSETRKVFDASDPSKTYYFRIAALDTSGNYSSLSNEANGHSFEDPTLPSSTQPLAPSIVAIFKGWNSQTQNFEVGVNFNASETAKGSVTETEIVWDAASGFDPDTATYSKTIKKPPVAEMIAVDKSDGLGLQVSFAARVYNPNAPSGSQYSDWSDTKTVTVSNSAYSKEVARSLSSLVVGRSSDVGGAIHCTGKFNDLDETLYGWNIRLATSLAKFTSPTLYELFGAKTILVTDRAVTLDVGSDIVADAAVDFVSAGVQAGDLVCVYKSANISTGAKEFPAINPIKSVSTHEIQVESGGEHNRTIAEGDTTTSISRRYFIFRTWLTLATDGVEVTLKEHVKEMPIWAYKLEDDISLSVDAYVSAQLGTGYGYGPWMYWDNSSGTATSSSAYKQPKPSQKGGSHEDFSVTAGEQVRGATYALLDLEIYDVTDSGFSYRAVGGGTGTLLYLNGDTQSIAASSKSGLAYDSNFLLYMIEGNSVLQITTDLSTASGEDRHCVGSVSTPSDADGYCQVELYNAIGGSVISAHRIYTKYLSSLSANVGELTGGTLTGLLIRTSDSGLRVQLANDQVEFYNTSGGKSAVITAENTLGNEFGFDLGPDDSYSHSVDWINGTYYVTEQIWSECIPGATGGLEHETVVKNTDSTSRPGVRARYWLRQQSTSVDSLYQYLDVLMAAGGTSFITKLSGTTLILEVGSNEFTWPTGFGSSGQFLKSDGAGELSWDTPSAGSVALNDLTDVGVSSPATGQLIRYNGSSWANWTPTYYSSGASMVGEIRPPSGNSNSVGTSTYYFASIYAAEGYFTGIQARSGSDLYVRDNLIPDTTSHTLGNASYNWYRVYATNAHLAWSEIGTLYINSYLYGPNGGGNLVIASSVEPSSDNSKALGTSSKRWSDVRSVLINGADIGFANAWKFREYGAKQGDIGKPDEWFMEHAAEGIQLLDDQDHLIAVFHKTGFYVNGPVRRLSELPA